VVVTLPEPSAAGSGRRLALWALAGYLVFLYTIAVFLFQMPSPRPNLVPFHTMAGDWRAGGFPLLVNFLGNIVAFLPMGAVPARLWPGRFRLAHAAAFGLGFSLLIEASQLALGTRVPDVDDLILNTLGAAVGYALLGRRRLL
jgi:glycopeptide antibiotics resistance protein